MNDDWIGVIGAIFFFVAAIFIGYGFYSVASLPQEIEEIYSLEWIPSDASIKIDQFRIDTEKGEIKYFYLDKQTSKVNSITHPLGIEGAENYNVKLISVINGYLVVCLVLSVGAELFAVIALLMALIFGILGITCLRLVFI